MGFSQVWQQTYSMTTNFLQSLHSKIKRVEAAILGPGLVIFYQSNNQKA
jgi:hypothetical protein